MHPSFYILTLSRSEHNRHSTDYTNDATRMAHGTSTYSTTLALRSAMVAPRPKASVKKMPNDMRLAVRLSLSLYVSPLLRLTGSLPLLLYHWSQTVNTTWQESSHISSCFLLCFLPVSASYFLILANGQHFRNSRSPSISLVNSYHHDEGHSPSSGRYDQDRQFWSWRRRQHQQQTYNFRNPHCSRSRNTND